MKITFKPAQLKEPYRVLSSNGSGLSVMQAKNLRFYTSNKPVIFKAGDEVKTLSVDTVDGASVPTEVYYKGSELLISKARKLFFLGCTDQDQGDLRTVLKNLSAVGRYMYDLHHEGPINEDLYPGFSEGVIFDDEPRIILFESAVKEKT